MISLILAMVATRSRQAVILLLLSVFGTAAAVAAPVFLDTAHEAAVLTEARQASTAELTLRTSLVSLDYPPDRRELEDIGPTMLAVPGFARVFYAEIEVVGLAGDEPTLLMFREDVCAHLRLVRGRCVMGAPETMLSERTARRLDLDVGSTVTVAYATFREDIQRWVPDGVPAEVSVVGVYRPADPEGLYWGGHSFFPEQERPGGGGDPMFVGRRTLEAIDHAVEYQGYDVIGRPEALTAETVDDVEDGYAETVENFKKLSGAGTGTRILIESELPALLARIRANTSAAGQLVPLAALPLVGLCWFVVFLAVGYGAAGRREEIGLVALRGTGRARRWWLTLGEPVLPVLAGAPIGYLVGHLLVWASVTAAWDVPVRVAPSARPLPYAAAAVLGAVLACVLAQWRVLAAPVVDLLRGVPARAARWSGLAVDALVAVCAVVAVVQLRTSGGELVGVTLLVPALIMLAVAMVGARAVVPGAGALAAAALRAGRLGLGLAAVQLARRPGSQRLLALMVVAVAMLGFTATAIDVGGRARADRAEIELGAARVLSVGAVDRQGLLSAVRAADPDGEFAMAVTAGPDGGPDEPPKLAVDSTRLARVASRHPAFDLGAAGWAGVVDRLRPPVRDPLVLRGRAVTITATVDEVSAAGIELFLQLRPVNGGFTANVNLGELAPERRTYTAATPRCATGCRLAGIVIKPTTDFGYRATFTVHDLAQAEPAATLLDRAALTDPTRWRPVPWRIGAGGAQLSAAPDGLDVVARGDVSTATEIVSGDGPAKVPVLSTRPPPTDGRMAGLDGKDVPVAVARRLPAIPRLGDDGVLMDLEYGERATIDTSGAQRPEVWLTADAPADAVDRLTVAGLRIVDDQNRSEARAKLDRQGSAVALRFHLSAAALAVLLGAGALWLVATVDRARRGRELWALRVQGVSARTIARASRWGYLAVVAAALLVGPVAAAVAWAVVGDRLPVFVDGAGPVSPPAWPRPGSVALAWLAAAVVLLVVGVLAARSVRRAAYEEGGVP
jgi:hypothetical protein